MYRSLRLALHTMWALSWLRYIGAVWLLAGLLFSTLDIVELVLVIATMVLAHNVVRPYTGWRLEGFQVLADEHDFVPLPRCIVGGGARELDGEEYRELVADLSSDGKKLLQQVLQSTGKVTVYDAVNIAVFDEQVGRPRQSLADNEALKEQMKERIMRDR